MRDAGTNGGMHGVAQVRDLDPSQAHICSSEPGSSTQTSAPGGSLRRPTSPQLVSLRVSRKAEYEMRDRPLVAGLQDQAANHLEPRRSRAGVVSVKGKARKTCQVGVGKTSASEPLMKRRNTWSTSKPGNGDVLG